MTGTWINMAAIVAGAVLGMLAKKGIPHRVEESLTRIQGLAVGLIGLNGVIASMFTVDADGGISDSGGLLLLVSLVLGCQAGELLRIDDRLSGLGDAVEKRVHIEGFSQGFITASIITCVPRILVWRNTSGFSIDRSTWLSAAKLTTMSGFSSSKIR